MGEGEKKRREKGRVEALSLLNKLECTLYVKHCIGSGARMDCIVVQVSFLISFALAIKIIR